MHTIFQRRGDLLQVKIHTDGSGFGSQWLLGMLSVTNLSTGAVDHFRHHEWVSTAPVTLTNSADVVGPISVNYTVSTFTSNLTFAGTFPIS